MLDIYFFINFVFIKQSNMTVTYWIILVTINKCRSISWNIQKYFDWLDLLSFTSLKSSLIIYTSYMNIQIETAPRTLMLVIHLYPLQISLNTNQCFNYIWYLTRLFRYFLTCWYKTVFLFCRVFVVEWMADTDRNPIYLEWDRFWIDCMEICRKCIDLSISRQDSK